MEKVKQKNVMYYIDNMNIKFSFVFYALIFLVDSITISIISKT